MTFAQSYKEELVFDALGFLTPRTVLFSEPQFNLEIVSHFDFFFFLEGGEERGRQNDGWLVYHDGSWQIQDV